MNFYKVSKVGLGLAFVAMLALTGCVSSKYAERTAETIKVSTGPASKRVENLRTRDEALVNSYNALKAATLQLINELDTTGVCDVAYWKSLSQMHRAENELMEYAQKLHMEALSTLPDKIKTASKPLQILIDEKTEILMPRQGAISVQDQAQILEAQKNYAALKSERDVIQKLSLERGVSLMEGTYKEIAELVSEKRNLQLLKIKSVKSQCINANHLANVLLPMLGPDIVSPEHKYNEMLEYLKNINAASEELKIFLESYSLGDRSFAASLMQGVWKGVTDSIDLSQDGKDEGALSESLKSAFANVKDMVNSGISNYFSSMSASSLLPTENIDTLYSNALNSLGEYLDETVRNSIQSPTVVNT